VPEFYGELKGLIDKLDASTRSHRCGDTEGISSGSRGIKISIWLESYTTIPGAGSDIGRR